MNTAAPSTAARLVAFVATIKQAPLTRAEQDEITAIVNGATRDPIAWGAHVSATFRERVRWISEDLSIGENAHDGACKLMACMAWESGLTFAPGTPNRAGSGAVGLVQFMPSTASALGTTTARLAAMSAEDQLNYVWKYFAPYKRQLRSLADVYMAILWPAAIGLDERAPLWSRTGRPVTYRQNSGLDVNTDGLITKGEAAGKVAGLLAQGLRPENLA